MNIGLITSPMETIPSLKVYITNLVRNLNMVDKENDYYLIHHSKMHLDVYDVVKEIISDPPNMVFGNLWWKYRTLPKDLESYDLDLVHDTQGISTFFIKEDPNYKKVITIHDLSSLVFPKMHVRGMLSDKILGHRTMKNADKIITVSKSTKEDLMKYFEAPEEKIKPIYLGVDEKFRVLDKEKVRNFKIEYKLDFPFILYFGVLRSRKNIPTLIKAYNLLKKDGTDHKLVIAGGKNQEYKKILNIVKDLHLENDVIFTGHMPEEIIVELYNAADLFVFPSLYEGFGLPPLEAMACGTPVITSNASSLPEVVGDAGLMVDPHDIQGLKDAMNAILSNLDLRIEMVKKGLNRSKEFTWKKCALKTMNVYKEV